MKVLFDDQIFSSQVYGGVSRYFAQILKQFHKDRLLEFNLSLLYSENDYIKDAQFAKNWSFLKDKNFKGSYRVLTFLKKLNRWNSVRNMVHQKFDLFHPTYYDPYFLEHIGDKPFVLTVYDMIHEIYLGKYFQEGDLTIQRKKKIAKKAAHIIAISENTKKDIIQFYGIDENKVSIVYLANSLDIQKAKKVKVPEKYILFVGDRMRYKNFVFFVKSLAEVLKKYKDLSLVCAGGGAFKPEEIKLLEELGVKERVLQCAVDDAQLTFLYKHALCFVFPSLYEGFGIPILESFYCGCPVLLSNKSCFPEVAQDAALYFDETSLENVLEKIICDKTLRQHLSEQGLKRVQDFSWNMAAQKTKKVYEKVL